jgi:hypothetical protein
MGEETVAARAAVKAEGWEGGAHAGGRKVHGSSATMGHGV